MGPAASPAQVDWPSVIAAATVVIQISVVAIVTGGIHFNRERSARQSQVSALKANCYLSIATILIIAFSESYFAFWSPIAGSASAPTLSMRTSLFLTFTLDIVFLAWLIGKTGGAKSSPFTSALFMIPALSVFLHDRVSSFVFYSSAVAAIYWYSSSHNHGSQLTLDGNDPALPAHRFVNLSCLALLTAIGIITAPQPV